MGWYKQACPRCWDNHDGLSCDEYQRQRAQGQASYETQRLLREQNDLVREQNQLLKQQKRAH